ncbi:MFS transporter [Mycolicibacterium phocaicum]|uniref:MFS transporter n=2 Tax=Mycolicibacterium TaxID=1866885 RepID=UPI003AF37EB8
MSVPDQQRSFSRGQQWTLVVSCAAVALVIGSMAALYTALPNIAVDTGAMQSQLTWVVDGYTLAIACLVLPAGAVGDRYGRRGVLIAGLAVFAAASVVPLAFDSPWWLIGARAAAGVGAALVMPSTLSILTGEFGVTQRRRAVGIWAGVAASGAVVGVLISGVLLQLWSWRAIFVGLAGAAVLLLVAALRVPTSCEGAHPRIDVLGSVVIALAIGLLVVALVEAPHRGWTDTMVMALFGCAAGCLVAFAVVELRRADPLLDMRLFRDRGFAAGTVSLVLHFVVIFGVFFLLVQYLQLISGYSPIRSAVALTPLIVPIVVVSVAAPQLAARWGLRVMLAGGLGLLAVGMFLASRLDVHSGYADIVWSLLALGTGLGLCTAPSTAAVVDATPVHKHGVAAAVNDAAREVGAAIGIAIAGSVLAAGYSGRVAATAAALPPPLRAAFEDSLAAAAQAAHRVGPVADAAVEQARSAFVHGCATGAFALGVISAVSAVLVAVWAPGRSAPPPEEPAPVVPAPASSGEPAGAA